MADHEDADLEMALRMSMQNSPPTAPEPKRSKPHDGETPLVPEESSEVKTRRLQRELMAAAAEKRMLGVGRTTTINAPASVVSGSNVVMRGRELGQELSPEEAKQLFSMVFGSEVSKGILAQWSNQGIRFSPDPETLMGLVQHEGGPCGVLSAIQVFLFVCKVKWQEVEIEQQYTFGFYSQSQCLSI